MTKKKSIFTQEVIVGIVLIALYFLFRTISSDFGKYTTFLSMMDISYYYAFMAIGVAFPLITGGVDLSIGTGMICYALAGGFLIRQYNCPTILAILVRFLCGSVADSQAAQRLVSFHLQDHTGKQDKSSAGSGLGDPADAGNAVWTGSYQIRTLHHRDRFQQGSCDAFRYQC